MSTEIQSQKMIIKNWGYKATNVYIEKYYKFPSFLIQNSKYSKMKDSSKIAYMLLKMNFVEPYMKNGSTMMVYYIWNLHKQT